MPCAWWFTVTASIQAEEKARGQWESSRYSQAIEDTLRREFDSRGL